MTDAVWIDGGTYRIGSDRHYPEERPARAITIDRFGMATAPVTNAEFRAFVAATGHVTRAERGEQPGSAIFVMSQGPVDLGDPSAWWRFVDHACWHAPEGPGSTIDARMDHPVVHIARADAQAYAAWAGGRLPSEAEWEIAARGGLADADYGWGDDLLPGGRMMANFWTGSFPWYLAHGQTPGTSAVGSYPANGYRLSDRIGNVWEWTMTAAAGSPERSCCAPPMPTDELAILKGGSFLCAAEYCQRYRPAARIAVAPEMTSAHIGFRLAMDH